MSSISTGERRGDYGVDAPPVLLVLGGFTLLYLLLAVILGPAFDAAVGWFFLALGLVMGVQFAVYLYATRRGKFAVWDDLLDELSLHGDEHLLDMGCGRGAVLLAAARRLPHGKAVGVDLWRSADQSGNARQATQANATAEGLADRVELHTGDMTALPFPDDSFDTVVSSLAIHNIKSPQARATAISEALRVLRPGGRLLIADISRAREYHRVLTESPAHDVTIRSLGWRMWWGGPWMPTRAVSATAA
ncbi:class I SAM-dependent methyltransferase [Nocardia pseudobrasiliensis]|uniref:Methyltransferase family protein n=1 Tax=Nocardia pseudobrasiliensis TaxID=45979 RepID=A0A370IH40_9NOCA|nr:class I SAM-dependent methyltransferase [Nocardia pseudobrasiliensis]RDI69471.1 methyltransferase family protein [Nocardia pseudobrasiliensis]